jgi:hypothetical protein
MAWAIAGDTQKVATSPTPLGAERPVRLIVVDGEVLQLDRDVIKARDLVVGERHW